MLLKKSTVASCSCSALPAFVPSSITSSCPAQYNVRHRRQAIQKTAFRFSTQQKYATVHGNPRKRCVLDDSERITATGFHWPSNPNPTPYQIFDHHNHAPYSKARFYELVKIYHPDRHHYQKSASSHDGSLTHAVRLERYRLVVAANEILSDPVKRRAYDLYGAGWGSKMSHENMYRKAYRSWRKEPGNPSMNATWEDWERWYEERDGNKGAKQKQQTVFMSNELFVVVLCTLVVVGSMGQAKRASTNTMNLVEMRDQKHAAINQDMNRRQMEQGGLTRHERVENFLRQREGWNVAASSPRKEHDTSAK